MRPTRCYDAISAGLFLDGDTAVLSFLTNDAVNDDEVNVVLTRAMVCFLHDTIATALTASHPPRPNPCGRNPSTSPLSEQGVDAGPGMLARQ